MKTYAIINPQTLEVLGHCETQNYEQSRAMEQLAGRDLVEDDALVQLSIDRAAGLTPSS